MSNQGIYAGPINTNPNRDRKDICNTNTKENRLWVLEFEIEGEGKGCSVVKANNVNNAIMSLKQNGMYNGTSYKYIITRVEEVIVGPLNELIAEQVVTYKETNNM